LRGPAPPGGKIGKLAALAKPQNWYERLAFAKPHQ
jgi:hypothetical protein